MQNKKLLIPNSITLLNLLFGVAAIVYLFEGTSDNYYVPAVLLVFAAICDVFDGLSAKLLKAQSAFGKELDSLADLISFGLAPAVMMYSLLGESNSEIMPNVYIPAIGFLVVAAAALRLARFNISTPVSTDFVGLPVPAAALIIVSVWVFIFSSDNKLALNIVNNTYFLITLVVVVALLMVSKIPMLSLKFTGISFSTNIWRYILLLGGTVLLIIFKAQSVMYIMIFYILLSIVKRLVSFKTA